MNSGPKYSGMNLSRTGGTNEKDLEKKKKKKVHIPESSEENLGTLLDVCVHMHGLKSKYIYICMLIVSSLGDGVFYVLLLYIHSV